MSKLVLIKSELFNDTKVDFFRNDNNEIVMTAEQLGLALDYSNPRIAINKLVKRNPYLKAQEFSGVTKLVTPGGNQEMRFFTEDGIYEITMLSKTESAKIFRQWVRSILKGLRKGQLVINQHDNYKGDIAREELKIRNINAEARLRNAKARQAKLILMELDRRKNILSPIAIELLTSNALELMVGYQLPRPQLENKHFTATQIAKEAGVSSSKIGRLANKYKLKNERFGIWVLDKSPYSSKQVESFRYNLEGRSRLLELLNMEEGV